MHIHRQHVQARERNVGVFPRRVRADTDTSEQPTTLPPVSTFGEWVVFVRDARG